MLIQDLIKLRIIFFYLTFLIALWYMCKLIFIGVFVMKKSILKFSTALGVLFCCLPVLAMDPPEKDAEPQSILTTLTYLHLEKNSKMTDEDLSVLTNLNTLYLGMRPEKITDHGVSGLTNLTDLSLSSFYPARITSKALLSLTNLQHLHLGVSHLGVDDLGYPDLEVDPISAASLLTSLPNLRTLKGTGFTYYPDDEPARRYQSFDLKYPFTSLKPL